MAEGIDKMITKLSVSRLNGKDLKFSKIRVENAIQKEQCWKAVKNVNDFDREVEGNTENDEKAKLVDKISKEPNNVVIHSGIVSLIKTQKLEFKRYILTFFCEVTEYAFVYLLKSKSQQFRRKY